tara:strand:+ start:203 stop:697 length:495 start_codon:yes stop_codon:yes gene_type:complete
MENAIWGLIGTIIGALTSILTTYLNSKNSLKIQTELEKSKREEKQSDFQKQNLLNLQELLYKNIRLFSKAHLKDLENYTKNNRWTDSRLSEELDESLGNSVREIWIYIERIEDEKFRNEAKEYARNFGAVMMAKEKDEAEFANRKMLENFISLMEELGKTLRRI